jgi:hypothetical protein
MTEAVQQTIELVQKQIVDIEADLLEKKRMVNSLCGLIKQPPMYADADLLVSKSLGTMRSDEYYGQPLATAVRLILERRKAAGMGPATVNEIYDTLLKGGFEFNTANDDYAKRGLYSALSKNTSTFHRLRNGSYGLLAWYPNAKEARPAKATKTAAVTEQPTLPMDEESAEAAAVAAEGDPFGLDEEAVAAPRKAK